MSIVLEINFGSGNQPPRSILSVHIRSTHSEKDGKKKWTGIWTDLSIEKILMKSLKDRTQVIGKGITENVMHVWTKTMHQCATVTEAMNKFILTPTTSNQHKEAYFGKIKRDHGDFEKIQVNIFS